jgi:hypothetical protein
MNSQDELNANLVCLNRAVLCVNCEVISEGNNAYCDACGSEALLNLNKLLSTSHKSTVAFHFGAPVLKTSRTQRSLAVSESVVRTDIALPVHRNRTAS